MSRAPKGKASPLQNMHTFLGEIPGTNAQFAAKWTPPHYLMYHPMRDLVLQGYIHKDVKLENIVIQEFDGKCRMVDCVLWKFRGDFSIHFATEFGLVSIHFSTELRLFSLREEMEGEIDCE